MTLGLDWGLPQEFHPDEPLVVPRAIDAVVKSDWNPHYFLVPSLQTELTSISYCMVYLYGLVVGNFNSPEDFGEWAAWNYGTLYLIGRGITVILGLLAVAGVALLTLEIIGLKKQGSQETNRSALWGSLLAALVMVVSPLTTQSSRLITPDIPMLTFFIWSIWAMIRASHLNSPRMLILGGFLAGLAVSGKYSAAILILPLLITGIQVNNAGNGTGCIKLIVPTIGGMLFGFLIGTPFALFDFSTFINHLLIQYTAQHQGHLGMEKAGLTCLHMLGDTITKEGPGLLILGLAGLGICWVRYRRVWWILVPLLVIYLVEVAGWVVYADRYLLPSLPFLAFGSALCVTTVSEWIKQPVVRFVLLLVLILALIIPPAMVTIQQTSRLHLPDTRTLALEWIEENIEPGSRILLEIGGPQPANVNAEFHREPAYDLVILPPWFSHTSHEIDPGVTLLVSGAEYAVTSSYYRSRYESMYAEEQFPEIAEAWRVYYDILDSQTVVVYEVRPGLQPGSGEITGPAIQIFRTGLDALE